MSSRLEGVRASAGTGKTWQLTSRYLAAVLQGVAADQLLAATFTRKAAGEILSRAMVRLAVGGADNSSAQALSTELKIETRTAHDVRRALVELCGALHSVNVCTLDSYFSRLASAFYTELGLPAKPQILDDNEALRGRLIQESISAGLLSDDLSGLVELFSRLDGGGAPQSPRRAIERLSTSLYSIYRHSDEAAWHAINVPEDCTDAEFTAACDNVVILATSATNGHLRNAFTADANRARSSEWEAIVTAGIGASLLRNTTYQKVEISPEVRAVYGPILQRSAHYILARTAVATAAAYSLLKRFDAAYSAARAAAGVQLYEDIPLALQAAAMDTDEVAYRLDSRISHLMLDEFQDTSRDQWNLLKPLAQKLAATGGGVFCVGDAKQAIYGWRGGCSEVLDRLEEDIPGMAWQDLLTSYRSSPVVLQFVNRVFGSLHACPVLQPHSEVLLSWQHRFEPHVSSRTGAPGFVEFVETSVPDVDSPANDTPDTPEEGAIVALTGALARAAERILDLHSRNPEMEIGVLLRTNRAVASLVMALGRMGVPAATESGTPLNDDPCVVTILAALRFADHPGDTAAHYRVENSPLAAGILGKNQTPATAARRLRSRLAQEGYARVLAGWSEQLAPLGVHRSARRLEQLLLVADGFDRKPLPRPIEFVRVIDATVMDDGQSAPVRVMTVHKAKGLEFDAVVLPEMDFNIMAGIDSTVVDQPDPLGPIKAVYCGALANAALQDPALGLARTTRAARQLHEALCVLYVAMTRARSALHIIVAAPKPGKQSATITYAGILRAVLLESGATSADTGGYLYVDGDPDWRAASSAAAALTPAPVAPPAIRLPKLRGVRLFRQVAASSLEGDQRVEATSLLRREQSLGPVYGTLFHLWFSMLPWADSPVPSNHALLNMAHTAVPGHAVEWVERALEAFHKARLSPGAAAALARPVVSSPQSVEVALEREFAVDVDDALATGVFDRLVVWRVHGKPVAARIVDFKTDAVDGAGVAERVEYYRPQVEHYCRAAAGMLGLERTDVRAALLFTSIDVLVEVGLKG